MSDENCRSVQRRLAHQRGAREDKQRMIDLARYYNRVLVTQFHDYGSNTYERRRTIKDRLEAVKAAADTPAKVEVFLAFHTAAISRYPGSDSRIAVDWPKAEDFGIMPADLEAACDS